MLILIDCNMIYFIRINIPKTINLLNYTCIMGRLIDNVIYYIYTSLSIYMAAYANSKQRQVENRHGVTHEKKKSRADYFKCNKPGHVSGKCTTGNRTQ